ncbi:acyltransferase [Rhizobium sp. Leaf384]|uniref:GNAT family N-acetyltransferase n=1 Tax=unclassified Rhizobium TaxID=2613769 RepID=UPI0007139F03|nr:MULTISPECIES: GNAT family N-acetyltransferase [unclassified Rhizobium]KQS80251.1 acyltransferase [Rhizobium sp. Leaf384]KQS83453.1 acyltransferase [Rhizobium sp. Leaf383]
MTDTRYEVDLRTMDALSATDLYALLKLRVDVFVVEQTCPYPELDGKDASALHLRLLDDGVLLASARLQPPADAQTPARIGRVVVSPDHRGKHLGHALMREAISACETAFGGAPIALSAQSHLRAFYASFGFEETSAEYVEDGIPHVDMARRASPVSGEVA